MSEQTRPTPWYQEVRKDLPSLLLFLLLPVVAFPELFFKDMTLYRGDLTWIHYPLHIQAAQQWLSGMAPLWNPYVLSGAPFLAEAEIGVLQPAGFLFLLPIPAFRALTLFVTVQYFLAATFTYMAARSLGLGRAGATLAGLSFGFGGFLMGQVTNLNVMAGGAWLPLVFFGCHQALKTRRWTVAVLAGLPLGLHILAAHPQIPFYTSILVLGYGLFESVRLAAGQESGRWQEVGRVWGMLGLMFGVGLALAAPQILPTWELQHYSVRSAGVVFDQMVAFSLPPVHWITLILPLAFGNNVSPSFQGPISNFEETNLYIGMLPLVLVFFSWRVRRKPVVIFLWIAVVLSALLAMGGYTPLYQLLQHLPGFSLFRAPSRWTLVMTFAMALLAGFGFEDFLERLASKRVRWLLAGVWVVALASMVIVWFLRQDILAWAEAAGRGGDVIYTIKLLVRRGLFEIPDGYNNRILLRYLAWQVTPGVAFITRLGLAVALLAAYASRYLSRRVFVSVAVGLVAIDMCLAGGTAANRITGADHWQQLSGGAEYVLDELGQGTDRFWAYPSGSEDDVVAGLKQYMPSARSVFASYGYSSLGLSRFNRFVGESHPLVMLSLTDTRFILNKGRMTADAESVLPMVYDDGEWYVYENPSPMPHAFAVHNAQAVQGEKEAISILQDRYFDPRLSVILETDEELPPLSGNPEQDRVTITRYTPNQVKIKAELAEPGYVVLLDNFYPGWQAKVDGQPASIERAYAFARAVYVGAGEHSIQFRYQPLSFRLGLGLSVAGLLACVAAAQAERRRQVEGCISS